MGACGVVLGALLPRIRERGRESIARIMQMRPSCHGFSACANFFAFAVVVCLAARSTWAAQPQVPRLPSQPAGYVKYAITDLPAHFKNTSVVALDNTPADNLLSDAG